METLNLMTGDCEDGSILLANMLLIAGIPYWKIRLTAGLVDDGKGNAGGHAFLNYFYENPDDSKCKWILLDWCYYPNELPIENRADYKDELYYKETWFSWNKIYSYAKDTRMTNKINDI